MQRSRTISISLTKGLKYKESCMAAINETSFIIIGGGVDGYYQSIGKLTQIYNLETGTWTRMPDMEPGRYGPKCMNYMDGIMVVGGVKATSENGGGYTSDDVNFFNLTSTMWQKFPSMNKYRYEHILAPVNGIPTVIGGGVGQSSYYSEQYINGRWNNWIEHTPVIYSSFVQVPKDDFHC